MRKDSSPGTVKDHASVRSPSVTYTEKVEDCDSMGGSSSSQKYEDLYAEQGYPYNKGRHLNDTKNKNADVTRYFIIKSLSHDNIQLSIDQGIWATQVMNEPILDEAFQNSSRVILIFSVNMSGFFQGYAQMMSSVGRRRDNVWISSSGGSNPWGRTFQVKWLQLHNLPFQKTLHLKNPLNDYKPVKISRDCQELPQDIGEALCKLIDEDEMLKRAWIDAPAHHSSLFQQSLLAEAQNSLLMEGTSPRGCPESLPSNMLEHVRVSSQNHMKRGTGGDSIFQWGERGSFADSLSEEDFLDMTYEEYLEIHQRSTGRFANLAPSGSWQPKSRN